MVETKEQPYSNGPMNQGVPDPDPVLTALLNKGTWSAADRDEVLRGIGKLLRRLTK